MVDSIFPISLRRFSDALDFESIECPLIKAVKCADQLVTTWNIGIPMQQFFQLVNPLHSAGQLVFHAIPSFFGIEDHAPLGHIRIGVMTVV